MRARPARAAPRAGAWKSRRRRRRSAPGSPPTSFSATQPVVAVERRCPRRPWPSPARSAAGSAARARSRASPAQRAGSSSVARGSRAGAASSVGPVALGARAPRAAIVRPRRRSAPAARRRARRCGRPGSRRAARATRLVQLVRACSRGSGGGARRPRRAARSSRFEVARRARRAGPACFASRGHARRSRVGSPVKLGVELGQRPPRPPGSTNSPVDAVQEVVAGRAVDRPGRRAAPRRPRGSSRPRSRRPGAARAQPVEVRRGVAQAVGVVDAQRRRASPSREPAAAPARGVSANTCAVLDAQRRPAW